MSGTRQFIRTYLDELPQPIPREPVAIDVQPELLEETPPPDTYNLIGETYDGSGGLANAYDGA